MLSVCVDTSFLISFADPTRPNHATAVEYFRYCLGTGTTMFLSTLVAAEFEVGQPITDLPLQNFRILPFNLLHARRAARFAAALRYGGIQTSPGDSRRVIVNDLNILGQTAEEGIQIVLTEDESTMSRLAFRLRLANLTTVTTILLRDPFSPARIETPDERTLL